MKKLSQVSESAVRIVDAVETPEGRGARVKRAFPTPRLRMIDPFVLMDEFFVDPSAGFPVHPHRGFEALTYMVEGKFQHKDTSGGRAVIPPGGIQRITMGRGIRHSEMPVGDTQAHGIQLWVNLAQNRKAIDPSYATFDLEDLPKQKLPHGTITTIVGEGSLVSVDTEIEYKDINLIEGDYQFEIPPKRNGFLYVLSGSGLLEYDRDKREVRAGQVVMKGGKSSFVAQVESRESIRFILLSGKPHNEPVYMHGSYVD